MLLLTAKQMRKLDQITIEELGLPSLSLMENAGREVYREIAELYDTEEDYFGGGIWIFTGSGNNGADGFVAARHLLNNGYPVTVVHVAGPLAALKGDAEIQSTAFERFSGRCLVASDSETVRKICGELARQPFIAVDALFGTGLKREVSGHYMDLIDQLNQLDCFTFAIDIPSGLSADEGTILGRAVVAQRTLTLAFPKVGQFIGSGPSCSGSIQVLDISIPQRLLDRLTPSESLQLTTEVEVSQLFAERELDTNKGKEGHVLLLVGSLEKSGAAVMSAHSALRSGAGLVTVAVPASAHQLIKSQLLEAMSLSLSELAGQSGLLDAQAVAEQLEDVNKYKVIGIGPGLVPGASVCEIIKSLIERSSCPLVIDADGLNSIADNKELLKKAKIPLILTPHPGEMARLLGQSAAQVQENRVEWARSFAEEYNVILLLKGYRTVIALPRGQIYINSTGNPGMATAGMGDVLTGLICGYLAQGASPEEATLAAAFNHGLAADQVVQEKGERGVIASDVLEQIPLLHKEFYG